MAGSLASLQGQMPTEENSDLAANACLRCGNHQKELSKMSVGFSHMSKVRVGKNSPLVLKLLMAKNVLLRFPNNQQPFTVLHSFKGSYTHAATRSAGAFALQ